MNEKFITLRIDNKIHQKYKVICAELNILMGKQTEALILNFIKVQEQNIKSLKSVKKE